jgi:hypothetical protein
MSNVTMNLWAVFFDYNAGGSYYIGVYTTPEAVRAAIEQHCQDCETKLEEGEEGLLTDDFLMNKLDVVDQCVVTFDGDTRVYIQLVSPSLVEEIVQQARKVKSEQTTEGAE